MAASLEILKSWFDVGASLGATHMLVFVDDFDHTEYPVYVPPGHNPRLCMENSDDTVMECYSYALTWSHQAFERRALHWEMPSAPPEQSAPKALTEAVEALPCFTFEEAAAGDDEYVRLADVRALAAEYLS